MGVRPQCLWLCLACREAYARRDCRRLEHTSNAWLPVVLSRPRSRGEALPIVVPRPTANHTVAVASELRNLDGHGLLAPTSRLEQGEGRPRPRGSRGGGGFLSLRTKRRRSTPEAVISMGWERPLIPTEWSRTGVGEGVYGLRPSHADFTVGC